MSLWRKCMGTLMLLTAVVLAGSRGGPDSFNKVEAAGNDGSKRGSITIELPELGTEKTGVTFRLYSLSDLGAAEDFKKADKTSAAEMRQFAEKLEEKAAASAVSYREMKTDAGGKAVFADLKEDVYLLVQSGKAEYGTVAPFLVAVPGTEDGKEWIYDVTARPKGETPDVPETPEVPEKPEAPEKPDAVKTGDENALAGYGLLAVGALAVILKKYSMKRS